MFHVPANGLLWARAWAADIATPAATNATIRNLCNRM
jgi:hypothetical protein